MANSLLDLYLDEHESKKNYGFFSLFSSNASCYANPLKTFSVFIVDEMSKENNSENFDKIGVLFHHFKHLQIK